MRARTGALYATVELPGHVAREDATARGLVATLALQAAHVGARAVLAPVGLERRFSGAGAFVAARDARRERPQLARNVCMHTSRGARE